MKTLWIIDNYASEPQFGGISRQYDFARALEKEGIITTVITSSYSHFQLKYFINHKYTVHSVGDKSKIIYLKTIPQYGNSLLKRLINMIDFVWVVLKYSHRMEKENGKPDIVVGASIHPLTWIAAYILAKRYRSVFMTEVRDLWPDYFIKSGIMSRYHPIALFLGSIERWAFKRSKKIISSLPYVDRYICDKLGLPKEKIVYLGQPVDCERFDYNASHNLDLIPDYITSFINNSFVCVFTGYFMKYEGIFTMLGAAKILKEEGMPIKFLFVGSGKEKPKMLNFISKYSLTNVLVGERIAKEAIPTLLNKCQIYLCELESGSKHTFEYGISKNKLSEYLYGDGCVIFGFSELNNIINESNGGCVIAPKNSEVLAETIKKYYDMNLMQRSEIGNNGKRFIKQNYAIDVLAKKYKMILAGEKE